MLHGVLSGFVAGETRHLQHSAAAASAATTTAIPMVTRTPLGLTGTKRAINKGKFRRPDNRWSFHHSNINGSSRLFLGLPVACRFRRPLPPL